MKLAAIDIGSNAVRLQITGIIEQGEEVIFKKLQYIRFPLRLGSDVFANGKVSDKKAHDFIKLMRAFKVMIDLYEIDEYYACATSAMREAINGQALAHAVAQDCQLKIHIISGEREAELVNRVIASSLKDQRYLHIDVGGGSTELNVYESKKKVKAKSFPIGTVRLLKHREPRDVWSKMYRWTETALGDDPHVVAIGTGGNIRKLFELCGGEKDPTITRDALKEMARLLQSMSYEARMQNLQLNADRADVILPAVQIYIKMMEKAGARQILVPDLGLKDGIIAYLYHQLND